MVAATSQLDLQKLTGGGGPLCSAEGVVAVTGHMTVDAAPPARAGRVSGLRPRRWTRLRREAVNGLRPRRWTRLRREAVNGLRPKRVDASSARGPPQACT